MACLTAGFWMSCSPSSPPPAKAVDLPPAPSTDLKPKAYTLRLSPIWQVGRKFHFVSETSTNDHGSSFFSTGHFEADGEVLALLPDGDPQKVSYAVKALNFSGVDVPPALANNHVRQLIVEFASDHKRTITMDGKRVEDADESDALGFLWFCSRNHSDQEVYGPPGSVVAGATWPLNAAALKDFGDEDFQMTAAEGTMKLASVQPVDGRLMGTVTGNFTTTDTSLPSGHPERATMTTSTIETTITFPVNGQGVYKEFFYSEDVTKPTAAADPPDITSSRNTQEITLQ